MALNLALDFDVKAFVQQANCPACGNGKVTPFYRVDGVPTNSCLLFETEEEARAWPRGRIVLGFCATCGFIYNMAFEAISTEYSGRYEETQGFSPTFSRFHRDLASRFLERYGLQGKRVLEIGCGKGEFLLLLAELGKVIGIGVDPSARQDRIENSPYADWVTLYPEYYGQAHGGIKADAVVCKMTLEHIPDVAEFVSRLRRNLSDSAPVPVFFQIPEAERILTDVAFEDVYYEHCSYFSKNSLTRMFKSCGFEVLSLGTEYGGQYLTIEAVPAPRRADTGPYTEQDLERLAELIASFSERVEKLKESWRDRVRKVRHQGKRVVLWGSGSKAVSFLTSLGLDDEVSAAVDINPYRRGHYMPTTAHRIIAPEELSAIDPGLVIAMNRMYTNEIINTVRGLGISAEVVAL
jgi:SAM-dependent methyltransferase/Zn ribbon nucleic-acid-binding protein